MLRRYTLVAFHDAAREVFGEQGLRDIAERMPARERDEAFSDARPEWVPERTIIAWCFALWEGPASRDRGVYFRWLRRHTDLGFGTIRRLLLSMATPETLLAKANDIWQRDHTHGWLETSSAQRQGIVVLRDHPYLDTPQARTTIAEVFRYSVALTRASSVVETHALTKEGALEVRLRWG